jgi:hypothetical protein
MFFTYVFFYLSIKVKIVLGTSTLGLEQVQDEQLHKEEVSLLLWSLILSLVYVSERLYTIESQTSLAVASPKHDKKD